MRRSRFATDVADHHVLAVARSVPAASRLLDVVPLLDSETTKVTYTIPPGSVSQRGVERVLHGAGVDWVMPWEEAVREPYALALAASPKGGLHRIRGRLLLMPHGAGHNRLVNDSPGDLTVASGLSPDQLVRRRFLRRSQIIPSALALPHSEQRDRLHTASPELAARATVVGDPSFDRILAHRGRRDRYRTMLGVTSGQRLVVLSSTWNKNSLYGAQKALMRRLLAEVPVDDYQFALVAHPNVWSTEGAERIRLMFRSEVESGLRLIPPEEGWRAAIIAADLVVGDHGSVTYYASALGRPVLLAAFDSTELDTASPLLDYRDMVPALNPAAPLHPQLAHAIDRPTAPTRGLMIEYPGEAAERMRSLMYGLLDTPIPRYPAALAPLPDPPGFAPDATGWRVEADIDTGVPHMDLRRYPPGAVADDTPRRILILDREDVAVHRWQSADGWSNRGRHDEHAAAEWLVRILREQPRATVAVADTAQGHALLLDRAGTYLRIHTDALDAAGVAAAAAAWQRDYHPWHPWSEGLYLTVGPQKTRLRSTPPPPDLPVFRR